MVKANDLHLIIGAADIDCFPISDSKIILGLTELRTECNVCPIGTFQTAGHIERIYCNNADNFQREGLAFLLTSISVSQLPVAQDGRIENRFSTGSLCAENLAALAHSDRGAVVRNHVNLSRRTLLAQSIQSVIHRGVRLAQFQSRLRGIGQKVGFILGSADHGTPCGI